MIGQLDNHIDSAAAVGRRLKAARASAGLTQGELSFPGCTTGYVSRLEKGDRIPSLQVVRGLARRLGVSESWLARGEDKHDDSEERLADAELAARLGDTAAAITVFQQLADSDDHGIRVRARVGLAQIAFAADDAHAAIEQLEAVFDLEPGLHDAAALESLGRAYARVGEEEAAIGVFRRALDTAIQTEDVLDRLRFSVLLANALIDATRFDEATDLLGSVITDMPAMDALAVARVYWSQSRLHSLRGDPDSAVRYARRALALLDASEDRLYAARAYQMLAHVELDAGHPHEALEALARGRSLFATAGTPHDIATYALEEARALALLGRHEEAAHLAMQSAAGYSDAHPIDIGRSYAQLASTLAAAGDSHRASELYELAIEFLDALPNRYLRDTCAEYAQLLETTGCTDEALAYYKKAVGIGTRVAPEV